MKDKVCPHCKVLRPIGRFALNRAAKSGYQSWCKSCMADKSHKERKANPEKHKKDRQNWIKKNPRGLKNRNLKFEYGITLEQYETMLKSQEGLCKICKLQCSSGKALSVDHCHKTLRIRGLLCGKCNKALGLFNDDPILIRRAGEYLNVD